MKLNVDISQAELDQIVVLCKREFESKDGSFGLKAHVSDLWSRDDDFYEFSTITSSLKCSNGQRSKIKKFKYYSLVGHKNTKMTWRHIYIYIHHELKS